MQGECMLSVNCRIAMLMYWENNGIIWKVVGFFYYYFFLEHCFQTLAFFRNLEISENLLRLSLCGREHRSGQEFGTGHRMHCLLSPLCGSSELLLGLWSQSNAVCCQKHRQPWPPVHYKLQWHNCDVVADLIEGPTGEHHPELLQPWIFYSSLIASVLEASDAAVQCYIWTKKPHFSARLNWLRHWPASALLFV